MFKSIFKAACVAAVLGFLPAAASAQQVNGLKSMPRFFNDLPTSTLTFTNSNSVSNGTANINDVFPTAGGTGVNRHDLLLSSDAGATARTFNFNQSFTFSATLILTDGTNTPRKEAGLRLNSSVTGDVLFIVNSDQGEIVAFGGGGPFFSFRNPDGFNEPAYVPGQSITMGMTFRPGTPSTTGGTPATLEYFINRGAGVKTSGPLAFSNTEGGPLNFTAGYYIQGGPGTNANDFMRLQLSNINASVIVPEPASLGLLSVGAMGLLARRRKVA